ncbi:MAG: glycosyltransferase [Lachnospiraceae bacterium]|nr:glycosyltransferase [Lachnospiraceae bacterium]
MTKPKISIIVPIYNVEQYLSQCLDSLIYQTLKEIEIICVNDGSKDKSLEILKYYAAKDERIVVLDQPNGGVSVARNNALKHVTGDYYMFVDSDDWLDLETCEIAFNYIIQAKADCLMFSYTKEFNGHSTVNHIFNDDYFILDVEGIRLNFHRKLFGPIAEELSRPQDTDLLVSACMQLFRTDKFVHIPFVDICQVGTFEDGLYQMVLYKECKRFVYIDRPFYHYRKTNCSSITSKYNPQLFSKWQHLYDLIEGYIDAWNLDNRYREALKNRIALSVIGLGLNQVRSDDNIFYGGVHMTEMLQTQRYKESLAALDISVMPLSWKVFFIMAKHNFTTMLFAMLKLIEYLRTHKK